MNNQVHRIKTIEKINTSINECRTTEQVVSIEQFLDLYYKVFPFDPQFFKQEWTLDTQLKNRKKHLALLDDSDFSLSEQKMSLQRLDAYVQSVSFNKLRKEWKDLRSQLIGIDTSRYPALSENIIHLQSMEYGSLLVQEVQDMIYKFKQRISPLFMMVKLYNK
ncbi:hypothetical protein GXP67_34440 [Rhodocytophaga rosea]|uniref:Uncharacterized protein n=1 Tax=Rhodocytophaga rosea TaxID=2704465 RepID=A0A6C0GTZ8_9BACT|nr:hypothetical protein [Rhodocytophaga rosea]QHT71397.1 hypothetical protein GXP67_34440 [Rhodocytophaga rosea]